MQDQEYYGRFTPSAWNYIRQLKFTEKEQDMLRSMIEAKTETIDKEEIKSMVYTVVHHNIH